MNSVAESVRIMDPNNSVLHELFIALGREHDWTEDIDELVEYTQERWVGRDHGNSPEKDQFSEGQESKALKVLSKIGLRDEIVPPAGSYEHIVIIGGLMRVNRQRMRFVKEHVSGQIEADKIVFWAGQRLRDDRESDELSAVNLDALAHHNWVRHEMTKPEQPGEGSRFETETKLARLAYLERFPKAELVSNYESVYNFDTEGFPRFVLLDAPKVSRPNGASRHTTASCTETWLDKIPPSEHSSVLLVSGNPHSERNLHDVRQTAAKAGRPDINFAISGPAANPNASIQLYLGEVGRLLYMYAQSRFS